MVYNWKNLFGEKKNYSCLIANFVFVFLNMILYLKKKSKYFFFIKANILTITC